MAGLKVHPRVHKRIRRKHPIATAQDKRGVGPSRRSSRCRIKAQQRGHGGGISEIRRHGVLTGPAVMGLKAARLFQLSKGFRRRLRRHVPLKHQRLIQPFRLPCGLALIQANPRCRTNLTGCINQFRLKLFFRSRPHHHIKRFAMVNRVQNLNFCPPPI